MTMEEVRRDERDEREPVDDDREYHAAPDDDEVPFHIPRD
jgi:hypothetical protein